MRIFKEIYYENKTIIKKPSDDKSFLSLHLTICKTRELAIIVTINNVSQSLDCRKYNF